MRALLATMLDAFAEDPDEFFRRMKALRRQVKRKLRNGATVQKESLRVAARIAARRLRRL